MKQLKSPEYYLIKSFGLKKVSDSNDIAYEMDTNFDYSKIIAAIEAAQREAIEAAAEVAEIKTVPPNAVRRYPYPIVDKQSILSLLKTIL